MPGSLSRSPHDSAMPQGTCLSATQGWQLLGARLRDYLFIHQFIHQTTFFEGSIIVCSSLQAFIRGLEHCQLSANIYQVSAGWRVQN